MLRISLCLILTLAAISTALAQNENAKQILRRFDAIRPDASELGMYRLDWAESMNEALRRAAMEKRAVLLIVIHAKYGDVTSGHC